MHDLQFHLAAALNTLRKAGFLPYLLPRSLAGEKREGEQAVICQQPARSPARRQSAVGASQARAAKRNAAFTRLVVGDRFEAWLAIVLNADGFLFLLLCPHALPGADAVGQDLLHAFGLFARLVAPVAAGECLCRFAPVLGPRVHWIRWLRSSAAAGAAANFAFPELISLFDRGNHPVFAHPRDSQPIFDHPIAVAATRLSGDILECFAHCRDCFRISLARLADRFAYI
jgi:hypothetical protein